MHGRGLTWERLARHGAWWLVLAGLACSLGVAGGWAQMSGEARDLSGITYGGGSGASPAEAIVIEGAADNYVGVAAVYRYLTQKFGRRNIDWKLIQQSLRREGGRAYDVMDIELKDGTKKQLYFDITGFLGKY